MFDKNFYPTPENVLTVMLDGIKFDRNTKILEPSAGKGDIIDYCYQQILEREQPLFYRAKDVPRDDEERKFKKNLFAIELNPDLRSIVEGKKYNVIDDDFLTHHFERKYDLIVMNPPFDKGHHHLLKALENDPYAEIRCLLNSETLKNRYSKSRELLWHRLNEREFEIIELGDCFSDAERKTNVNITLIKVKKVDRKNSFNFDFSGFDSKEKMYTVKDMNNNQVETNDVVASVVHRYEKCKEIYAEIAQKCKEFDFYANGITDIRMDRIGVEAFTDNLRENVWKNIIDDTKISDYVTSKVREEIEMHQKSQFCKSISEKNIWNLRYMLMASAGDIRRQCIQQAFDMLTAFHEKNKVHIEGWKTNTAWKVNKKVIIPYFCPQDSFEQKWNKDRSSIGRDKKEKMMDIEKALCFVAGIRYNDIRERCISDKYYLHNPGEWQDSYFFEWKWFKKGTLHIVFKDADIWKRFNFEACAGRNWIGGEFQ